MSLAALSPTPAYGAQQAAERVAQLQGLIARAEEPATSALTGGTAAPSGSSSSGSAAASGSSVSGQFADALAQASAETAPSGTTAMPASTDETSPYESSPYEAYPSETSAYAPSAPLYASPGYGTAAPAYDTALASAQEAGAPAGAAAYESMIQQAAARYGVEPAVLHGLIQQESGFDPNAQSGAGAMGLTQLMPSTAAAMGVSNPLNPQESIEGGARYLGEMLSRFGGNLTDAIAAYNAGPGAVSEYGGVPPYAETQSYVSKVLENAASYRATQTGVIQ